MLEFNKKYIYNILCFVLTTYCKYGIILQADP